MRFVCPRRWARARRAIDFLASERGTATIELSLILPPALILLCMATFAGEGFELQRRSSLAARTVADLVSQAPYAKDPNVPGATALNQSALDTDLALASEIMWPAATNTLQVVVSELSVKSANNTGTVVWSEPYNGAVALPVGTIINLSPSIVATGATYLIYGQVRYTFQPLNIYLSSGAITLNETDLLLPRNASQITINWGQ
jgi:Flp pilus assembly protein TadG